MKSLSRVRLFATPWIAVRQASPGDLPDPGLPHCRQMLLPSESPGKSYLIVKDSS